MTKAEFKEKALKVLEGIKDSKELAAVYERKSGKGCLYQRIGSWPIGGGDKVKELWRLIPLESRDNPSLVAPLSEIRAWVESL